MGDGVAIRSVPAGPIGVGTLGGEGEAKQERERWEALHERFDGVHADPLVLGLSRACRLKPRATKAILKAFIDFDNYTNFVFLIGNSRIRFPVAAKIALHSAGAMGGTPGSPTPAGASLLATTWTWVCCGASVMRATG